MANVRIQPGRALEVIPSDFSDVPFPAPNTSGTVSALVPNQLIDASKNFVTLGVYAGDIVYSSTGLSATVQANPSAATPTVLLLNNDIFSVAAIDTYTIYQSSAQAGGQNTGCVLYVGGTGDLIVTTTGHDIVTLASVPTGSFIPVQVLKVWSATSASKIVALW